MDNTYAENETMFLSWLSSNVSPAQLSELYLAFSEIEQQAKKSKLIRRSLYEDLTVSAIKKIRADIERSRIFKFTHKRQWSRILSALDYLQKFAAQNQVDGITEKVTSSIERQDEATATDSYMSPEELKTTLPEQKKTEEVSSTHDECSVDYEKVVISYSRHTEPAPAPKPVVEPLQRLPRSSYSDENGIKNAYYRWLIDSQHKAESTSRVYANAIGNAEQIAKESGLTNNRLYTEIPDEAKATANALFSDPFFN